MKIFDKILISSAGLSAYGIAMIVFSGELNSEYFSGKFEPAKKEIPKISDESVFVSRNFSEKYTEDKKSKAVVIYDKEVDEIIEAYFKNIRQNPDKLEEENRLINEVEKNNAFDQKSSRNEKDEYNEKNKSVVYRNHVVQNGDSLWRISQKYNVPVYSIISLNPEKDKEMIRPGDALKIPSRSGILYLVKNGDSLSVISKKYKISSAEIAEVNGLNSSTISRGQKLFLPGAKPLVEFKIITKNRFLWPIFGKITSGYGMRKHPMSNNMQFHTGIDIGANVGVPFHATADGIVVYSGNGGAYGNMIIIRHQDGYLSVYAHASNLLVKKDQFVKQGQRIGSVGATGMVTGPHLHFEVKKYNQGMNPFDALNQKISTKVAINS